MSNDKYNRFKKIQLTSDQANVATYQDPNLIAAWGMAILDDTVWIANYGLVSNYGLSGKLLYHVVLPTVSDNIVFGTGVIINDTTGFVVTNGTNTAASEILVASSSGAIFGYNPLVDPTNAITVIDKSADNAVYTGITILGKYLCATDYFNNRVDVFDLNFNQVYTLPFTDLEVLNPLPSNVAPYNIVNIDEHAYVVYARQPDETGAIPQSFQISYVSIFNKNGLFIKRFINEHHNNSWALIKLPKPCHKKSKNKFLLGNSNGTISIYNKYGEKIGCITNETGCKMVIYGLKGLELCEHIYFTAAPLSGYDDNIIEAYHGLFGQLNRICHDKHKK